MIGDRPVVTDGALLDGTILRFLPSAVRTPWRAPRAILIGWMTALLPSLGIALVVSLVVSQDAQPSFDMDGALAIALLVVFAPVVETLIMGGVLLILLRLVGPAPAIIASAAGWAIAHSLQAAAWGLVIWWPFLVFSTLFVVWRQRSLAMAFVVPAVVHALHNLPPAILVASGQAA